MCSVMNCTRERDSLSLVLNIIIDDLESTKNTC
jgi:hypothetical protein